MSEANRYWIVQRDDLAIYGDMYGSKSKAEANELLSYGGSDDLVVIKGVVVETEQQIKEYFEQIP